MKLKIAGIQCSLSDSEEENVLKITAFVKDAAAQGAQVVLPPELFQGHYFCSREDEKYFKRAQAVNESRLIRHFSALAAELQIVIPVSFFEREGPHYYNSIAAINADGKTLGIYRKSHIPDGPGYEEKYYFRPGNTGFKVWDTRYVKLGVGICWDQWFPECARIMALKGAELLMYPTAIGSEPHDPALDTRKAWRRAMVGHAVSNAVPVLAANRIGKEANQSFYGNSFVCDHQGNTLCEVDDKKEALVIAEIDLQKQREYQSAFGFFRDRRPDLYEDLVKG